jgi:hypothetical protein
LEIDANGDDKSFEEKANELNDTFLTNKYVKDSNYKLKLKQSENNLS